MVDPPNPQSGGSRSIDDYFDKAVKKAVGQPKRSSTESKQGSNPAKDTISKEPEKKSASRNFPATPKSPTQKTTPSTKVIPPQAQELEPIEISYMGTIQKFRMQNPDGSITEYFRNNIYSPFEIKIEFVGENFLINVNEKQITDKNAKNNPQVIRIPARKPQEASPEIVAFTVRPKDVRAGSRYGYNSAPVMPGDSTGQGHDKDTLYLVPFPSGINWRVIQGHNDQNGTHHGENVSALDLVTDENDKNKFISAARDGVVIKIKDDSTRGGLTAHPINDNNEIWILHDDGSIGKYGHLQAGSVREAKLKLGDKIKEGQIIGRYGNSGNYSGLQHLHFQVDYPEGANGVRDIPIESSFKDQSGKQLPKLQNSSRNN